MRNGKACLVGLVCGVLMLGLSSGAWAHCEIPCGIYDDAMRIEMLNEHLMTIEKSMRTIEELSGKVETGGHEHKTGNMHQLVRWIDNKEEHARKFQDIVWQYFMTQRIEPGEKSYERKVQLLHEMLYYAMRCKQTTDTGHVKKLMSLVQEFEKLYFQDRGE